MIALRGIDKRYGTQIALHDVSLEVRPGAVTALVGPNGSGKTTLIKTILGLTRPDAGTVALAGCRSTARANIVGTSATCHKRAISLSISLLGRSSSWWMPCAAGLR